MNKVLTVAKNEYLIAITSKAFLVGVIMMPVFMGGALVVQYLTRDQVDLSARKLAVVDETGRLFAALDEASQARNEYGIFDTDPETQERKQARPQFMLESHTPSEGEETSLLLSDRVKKGEIFAYAIIDANVFEPGADGGIRYHTQTPSFQALPNWLREAVNQEVRRARIEELSIPADAVASLESKVPLRQFELTTVAADGTINDADEQDRILTFAVPFVGLMLMFMMIMSVAPAMLNNVLEEKMQKISEFLVSSITPFQLMLGKLMGAVAVGLTLSVIYLGAAFTLASYMEVSDKVPITIYLWFIFYLFVGLVIFGSIFSAIGAACSEIRDAQSLMTPVMMLVIIPMMCIVPILDSPSSLFSRVISLFPPATPMIMFMRIAIPPGPEVWEIVLGTVLTVLFACMCVWAAGKVFRIGILSQGQAPSLAKLIGWIFTK